MNDPVTNVEIEDVLSSIRRLVSENARPEAADEAAAAEEHGAAEKAQDSVAAIAAAVVSQVVSQPDPEGGSQATQESSRAGASDMLVLTPDHRITEDQPSNPADDPGEDRADDPEHDAAEADAETLPEFLLTPEAEVSPGAGQTPVETHHWGDDGAETDVEEIAERQGLAAAIEEAVQEALDEVVEDAIGADDATQDSSDTETADQSKVLTFSHTDEQGDDASGDSLENRIAELEAAVAEREDQWEPDGDGEPGDNAGEPVETLPWEDEYAGSTQSQTWESDPPEAVEEAELIEDEAQDHAEAQPEPVSEPDPEPELVDPESASEQEPTADPQLVRDLEPDPELFADTDSVIDEDTLREMVADIVRRELQGSLGERITRNVRKLVRREIHRALAARELD